MATQELLKPELMRALMYNQHEHDIRALKNLIRQSFNDI
jgi:hypothetical protein